MFDSTAAAVPKSSSSLVDEDAEFGPSNNLDLNPSNLELMYFGGGGGMYCSFVWKGLFLLLRFRKSP